MIHIYYKYLHHLYYHESVNILGDCYIYMDNREIMGKYLRVNNVNNSNAIQTSEQNKYKEIKIEKNILYCLQYHHHLV